MTHRVAAVLVVGAVACGAPNVVVTGDIPDGTYVAALALDSNGMVTSATGLLGFGAKDALLADLVRTGADVTEIIVYAYDRNVIDALVTRPDDDVLASSLVTIADVADPRLPDPVWVGRSMISEDRGALTTATDPPRLSTTWLPACPALLSTNEVGFLDEACRPIPCDALVKQRGCILSVDVGLCTGGNLQGLVTGTGDIDFAPSPEFGNCRTIPARVPSRASLVCTGGQYQSELCRADLYGAAPPTSDDYIEVITGPGVVIENAVPLSVRHTGGMVLFDQHVVVSHFERPTPRACRDVAVELQFYDPTTLQLEGTAAGPPCLQQIRRVPDVLAMVGVYREDDAYGVVRLDEVGRVVRTATIAPQIAMVPQDVAIDPFAGEVLVLMTTVGAGATGPGYLLRFDLDTLAPIVGPPITFNRYPQSVTVRQDGRWVVVDADDEGFFLIHRGVVEHLNLRARCGRTFLNVVREHSPSGRLLISSREEVQALVAVDPNGEVSCNRMKLFEHPGEPLAVADWPLDPRLMVAGFDGTALSGRDEAYLAFANIEDGHIEPGTITVGRGPIAELEVDREGRIYALLAWSDRLVLVPPP